MEKEYFIQQQAFMSDYKKVAKNTELTVDEIANTVIKQLNETQEEVFVLPAEESTTGTAQQFPFSRRVYSDENDGTINTEYTYEGQPYVLETDDGEEEA